MSQQNLLTRFSFFQRFCSLLSYD